MPNIVKLWGSVGDIVHGVDPAAVDAQFQVQVVTTVFAAHRAGVATYPMTCPFVTVCPSLTAMEDMCAYRVA